MMYDDRDQWIGQSFRHLGEFSHAECEAVKHYCKPGTVVLDIGANIGALTIPMSEAVGADGLVISCEPQYLVHQILVGNVALDQARNVMPLNVAVGREPGKLLVPDVIAADVKEFNSGALELDKPHINGKLTQVVTVDSLIHGDKPVSCIKIDVEGMEPEVLMGAANTIVKHKPVVYFEIDRPSWSKAVAILLELGYRCFSHQPALYRKDNFAGYPFSPWLGNMVSCNCIAIHKDKFEMPPFVDGIGEIIAEKRG
jgi:FkbM family methyltransferase